MASFSSISSAVKTIQADVGRINILINNAGVAAIPGGLTSSGYEIQFGTNYMGHALLTHLLLPMMLKVATSEADPVRIINVSSEGYSHIGAPGIHFYSLKDANAWGGSWTRYAQSKLANILHVKALAKRYPAILSVSVHPGTVNTDIFNKMNSMVLKVMLTLVGWAVLSSVEDGAKNQLWAATSKDVRSGVYYTPVGVKNSGNRFSEDDELADELWEWTEAELKKHGF
jgi:retinol dehydrogenase-12